MSDITVYADLFPEGREPADSGEAAEWILRLIETGRRAAVRIAVLIAHVRDTYYPENAGG